MAPSKVVFFLLLFPFLLQTVFSISHEDSYILPKLSLRSYKASSTPAPLPWEFKTHFYNQTLDHFNYGPESYNSFKQKYVVNHKYWDEGNAPIFAYLGGDGPLDVQSVGFLNDNAQHFNSLSVFIEHRFYGMSSPYKSTEEALKNDTIRGYFNSAQALADYAEILVYIRRLYSTPNTPIVVVGEGTYGGMLATWFRLKYPHITAGALASSAPIFYFDKITQLNGFDRIVANDYRSVSESCFQTIRNSWAKIGEVASQPNGLSILSDKFNTCMPLKNSTELNYFLESMYEEAAQFDAPPTYPVTMICEKIDDDSSNQTDILDRISAGVAAYRGNNACQDMKAYDFPSKATAGWNWQVCTEMVIPTGSSNGNETLFRDPYSIFKLGRYKRRCSNHYGIQTKPFWIQTYYGGSGTKMVLRRFASNIIFSNGLRDPDSSGGVLEDFSKTVVAITTAKGSNTLDIRPAADTDPEWLVLQRYRELLTIEAWLRAYYVDIRALSKTSKAKSG